MKASKVAQYGLLIALALVLSYLESLVPPLWVPGVKLGLPNLAIVFALYRLGFKDACVISLVRVVLVALLFGNGAALAYSVAGAALSLSLMGLLKKTGKFSSVGVSVAGGVARGERAWAKLLGRGDGLWAWSPRSRPRAERLARVGPGRRGRGRGGTGRTFGIALEM